MFYRFVCTILWIIVSLITIHQKAFATHAAGAQLTVEHVSGNTYNVSYIFYRDCAGVSAPNNVTIDVNSFNCGISTTLTLDNTSTTEITHACASAVSTCNGGTVTGIQKYIYEATITLDSACTDWVFSHDLCCRNHSITTLNDPGSENIYLETHFNTLDVTGNSTPQFNNDPILFTCLNQSFTYNNGVIDVDGDSLVFSLSDPMHLAGTPVIYNAGYSAVNPLTTSSGFNINSQTGEITFTPSAIGIGVIVVKVDEYRNGVLISTVYRDMQIYVDACTGNSLPTLSGINNSANYSIAIPANQNTCFNILSQDLDTADILTMIWNNGIPAGTFTTTAGNPPVGQFCWTPTFADTLQNPHVFTVLVLDDNCPLNGAQVYTYSVNVVFDTTLACSIAISPVLCTGNANASLTGTAIQGVAPYNYLWSTGATDSLISNLVAGMYSLMITDSLNDTAYCNVTIADPAPLSLNLLPTDPTCNNLQDGLINAQVNGGTAPYVFAWSNGMTTSTVSNLVQGTYSVTVTDANLCSTSSSITLTNPVIISCSISGNSNLCFGQTSGSLAVTTVGGSGNYTYLWSSGQTTSSFQGTTGGVYTVTVSDVSACTTTCTFQVTELTPVSVSYTSTDVTCAGMVNGTALITPSGGSGNYTYYWSSGSTTNSSTNLSGGTYTVIAYDFRNCSGSAQIVIDEPAPLAISLTSNNVTCNGASDGSAYVSVIGGTAPYTVNWYSNSSLMQPIDMPPGVYSVEVIDANGCSTTSGFSITEPNLLTVAAISENVTCYGIANGYVNTSISGGVPPYQFNWSNGAGIQNLNSLSPGNYTLTVTDNNACTATVFVQITEPSLLNGSVSSTNALCNATATGTATANVWGGVGNYSYLWSNGVTSAINNSLVAGVYTINVTDLNSCSFTSQVIISEPLPILATVSTISANCNGDSTGSASVNISGGIAPHIVNWYSGVIPVNELQLTSGNYNVVIQDLNGCSLTQNFYIIEPPALNLTSNLNHVTCNSMRNGSIQAIVSGGIQPYSYLWSNASSNLSINSLPAGLYSVTVTDNNGCNLQEQFIITEPTPLLVTVTSDTSLCYGETATILASATGGNGNIYQYNWSGGMLSGPGPYTFVAYADTCISIYAIDSVGCVSLPSITCITVGPPIVVAANAKDSICMGDTITLSAIASGGNNGPYYYSWGFLGNGQTLQTVPDTYPGYSSYIVSVTDSCSPTAYDTVNVYFHEQPHEYISLENTEGCAPLNLQVSNNSIFSDVCTWSMGTGDIISSCSAFNYVYDVPGTYLLSVEMESIQGCRSKVDTLANIEVYSLPVADFKYAPLEVDLRDPEINFYNNSVDAVSYEWHFGDGNISYEEHPIHMYSDSGLYVVTLIVENEFGCRDSHQLVVIIHMNLIVYIPNTFTPNFDGTNDNFYPKGVGINDDGYELQIFNRWGDRIYRTTQKNGYWDGTIKHSNNQAPQGVYLYLLTVSDYKKKTHYLQGTVTLIR